MSVPYREPAELPEASRSAEEVFARCACDLRGLSRDEQRRVLQALEVFLRDEA